MNLNLAEVRKIVEHALAEDIGTGDITTALTIPVDSTCHAEIVAKEDGIVAGLQVAVVVLDMVADVYSVGSQSVYRLIKHEHHEADPRDVLKNAIRFGTQVDQPGSGEIRIAAGGMDAGAFSVGDDKDVYFIPLKRDGERISAGDVIARIVGPTVVVLTAERTLLNFLQRMSGIATKAAGMVELVAHTEARIVDTRKTAPGLRLLDKYAVRAGGAQNHRYGLYDAVLIKDNHIQAAGSVREAIENAKAGAPHTIKIEVEADTLDQVREALDAGADMILLDNMDTDMLREAVALCKGRALTEASGNVTEETAAAIAETGVDLISVGALTHSVKALDLGLDITE
jgi:nicotinate-nucleotide pyrophosphorylase (carboxylating)